MSGNWTRRTIGRFSSQGRGVVTGDARAEGVAGDGIGRDSVGAGEGGRVGVGVRALREEEGLAHPSVREHRRRRIRRKERNRTPVLENGKEKKVAGENQLVIPAWL
jgi:hypothetical protein